MAKDNKDILAERFTLKQLRQKLGHSQSALAARAGKKQPTIAVLENAANPRVSSIVDYLSAIDCDFDIIGRDPNGEEFRIFFKPKS